MTARLLIVDDVVANGRLLEASLTANYYVVKFISDSRLVRATVEAWEPDVILLDIMMPHVNGYEVCEMLKSQPATAHIPVIMVTALKDRPDRHRALAAGADEFLVKPVESEVLLARLRGIIRLKQLLDEWRARGNSATALGLIRGRLQDAPVSHGSALIVEDLPARSSWIQALFNRDGIQTKAVDGDSGPPGSFENGNFDLIIISLSLMSHDPLRLLARLRAAAATRDTPILLVAEAHQRELLINGLDLGASDCISVPIDDDELLLRAKNHIRRKQYQDRLRTDVGNALELAAIDPMTKVFNRRYLMNFLDRLCDDTNEVAFAVLMIDVDHFKSVNDRFGHLVGDRVLITLAALLQSNLRKSDVVARYGGEEFVVLVAGISSQPQVLYIAEKLRAAVQAVQFHPQIDVTISVGVAVSGRGLSGPALLHAADEALYDAKREGRNRVTLSQADPTDIERRGRFDS